jgi:hypothetical protein
MRALRRQKRLLSWLAGLALLGNVLAMAFIVRPVTVASVLDDVLGPVILCTADGAKALAPGGPGPLGHAPGGHCPACVSLAQFALAVAVVLTALAFPLLPAPAPAPVWRRPPALRLRLGGISARAPPALA